MIRPQSDLYEWISVLVDTCGDETISVDDAIRKTRSHFPGLSVSDEDLTQFIATRATADGRSVEFGHK